MLNLYDEGYLDSVRPDLRGMNPKDLEHENNAEDWSGTSSSNQPCSSREAESGAGIQQLDGHE